MDIASWLNGMGLRQYEHAFRNNDIDGQVVASLTDADLQEIGIASLGHRKRLLDAISRLAKVSEEFQAEAPLPAISPERRYLTVLFCDLVDSAPLSIALDPEELRRMIVDYQNAVVGVVKSTGGYVARTIGDGLLAYFGWPRPDEAHVETAVHTALAILDALAPQRRPVRIGIATGLVVVGDIVAQEATVIGETPNLAARLRDLAGSNDIVLCQSTARQLGGVFALEDMGRVSLKGFDEPQRAWRVEGEAASISRSEALPRRSLTPLVGRDEDIGLLHRRWNQAKAGDGQLVLISGESGIGKTRLVTAFEEQIATEPYIGMRYFCTAHHQDSALHPVVMRWEREAGFAKSDSAETRLAKLERAVSAAGLDPDEFALIAAMLSVSTLGRYPDLNLSPQRLKERTFDLLIRRSGMRAERQPMLMILEDVHWADPSTLELFDRGLDRLIDLPVLMVITYRPEFAAPWIGRPHATVLALSRLSPRRSAELAAGVMAEQKLPPELLDRIAVQADGVPLFIEELTKAVAENATSQPDMALPATVPATLQASLMARLDRIPIAKQVAQIGSVIGREFPHGLLAKVAGARAELLNQGLDELIASGLVFRRGVPPEAIYSFKHALVQDVAYESLLRSRRAAVHGQIVDQLEGEHELDPQNLPLLAYHAIQAGLAEKAVRYCRLAGEQAELKAGLQETRSLFDRGLALIAMLPDTRERRLLRAELLIGLARVLQMLNGVADPEAAVLSAEAIEIGRTIDETEPLERMLMIRYLGNVIRTELDAARADGEELLSVARRIGDPAGQVLALLSIAHVDCHVGNFRAAWARVDSSDSIRAAHPSLVFRTPSESGIVQASLVYWAIGLGALGHLDQAASLVRQLESERSDLPPMAAALQLAPLCRYHFVVARDSEAFRNSNQELLSVSEEHKLQQFIPAARANEGWIRCRLHGDHAGVRAIESAVRIMMNSGHRLQVPSYLLLLADALMSLGRAGEAVAVLDRAIALSVEKGNNLLLAELHRTQGKAVLREHCNGQASAKRALDEAISIARAQSAKLFELRAATALARLWAAEGRRLDAQALLRPVHDWFAEGRTTPDLELAEQTLRSICQ